jgi:sugar transferase EpsL
LILDFVSLSFTLFPHGVPPIKRLFDLALAFLALIPGLPLMAVIALILWFKAGKPVIFQQARPGLHGRIFKVYKFRSMHNKTDQAGKLLRDDERLFPLGKFLRATSLDELPELFNVLRGEMSWVGPRPLLIAYLERYTPEQARRHNVLPGITGWAQVNGRNILNWEEKFRYDVWYVDHWSFCLDIKILWRTAGSVLRREGINQPGQATAEEFKGSNKEI